MSADRRRAGRGARPASHRRRAGFRRRRPLLSLLLSAFLLVGVCAATGIAWEPRTVADARTRSGPGPAATLPGTPGDGPAPATTGPTATGAGSAAPQSPGGPAPDPKAQGSGTDGGTRPTGALPFDLPQPAALRSGAAGKKLVFAHYFTPYPLSLDNANADVDYYTRNYLKPDGESGKHARYGGLLRDRPPPVAPKAGNWELANLQQEVRTARAAGIDGFTLDLLSLSGKNLERCNLLMEAARSVDPGFKIMLMPDMTSLGTDDPAVLADLLADLGTSPAAHRLPDGRLVVSPFKAEEKSAAWWTRVMDVLKSRHGIRTAFVPLFLDFGAHRVAFESISYGFSEWGSRSYVGQEGSTRDVRRAHAAGKIWMQPVSVQDARPNQGIYDEAGNTATLRATWNRAIEDGADWVQLTTWNDYSEGSQFAPSLHNGHAYLDLSSYYLTRFKTGGWPKIVRDTLYLSSRTQFAAADPAGGQSLVMSLRGGSAAARDTVEVLSFLTAPASIRTAVGAAGDAHEAPAGVHSELIPLRPGAGSAAVVRDGRTGARVELPYRVDRTVEVQDLQYHAASSGRG
ncbi:endo-1,3-alpha-glucanase family glycosylhydrolase [Streptomyces sp. NBC_00335]|uniref:glycoside hydrolase family 71 protein n=1 Tax=unclassified Streptomyces TaxID=2593676 RepID=UPI00225154E7|nr:MULTISPECIES: endo-1,3-alpha-glucanase family glycosylhydrolase [unclassified Streptomyces]MCX5403326.1 endo-1,3-alpha-glucanase family glycosylhydrolase [Streptomyces sp. NBC_00086]